MILSEHYVLNNGISIPKLGFGTWQIPEDAVTAPVLAAIEAGYRHIDTAAAYGNERGVGAALAASPVPRESLFLTTKIPAEVKTYEGAKEVIAASLANLGTDYIDLMLIHAPKPWSEMWNPEGTRYFEENAAVWKAMEEAYKEGKLRAIGVSNFNEADLDNILTHGTVKPAVNQIQVHIGHTPVNVMEYCENLDILIMAYAPNATGKLVNHPVVAPLARKYNVTIPQLCIRYCLQLNTLPLPKTTHTDYILENAAVDFIISEEDMTYLKEITSL